MPSKEQLEMATRPSDEELVLNPEMKTKLEKLMKYFDEVGIDYSKFDPESIPHLDFSKKDAYPNFDQYMHIPGQHNTQKWLAAVRSIYQTEKSGSGRVDAIRKATSGWNIMETYDFLNWLKYHESGDHLKYKFAQLWYENGAPGYFLHVKPDPVKEPEPQVTGRDIDFARDSVTEKTERKQIIEKQRNKIIGRLDSAEKLLRSPDGQIFSGKEFESLLESIYELKKRIQMVNKISSSTRLYEDMIVRQANVLQRQGFTKAASVLHSLAQSPAQSGEEVKEQGEAGAGNVIPPATPPDDPTGAGHPGAPGGLPSMGPGMPQNAPSDSVPETGPNENFPGNPQGGGGQAATTTQAPNSLPVEPQKSKGISEFLEGMETSKFTTDEGVAEDDGLEVDDNINVADDDMLLVTEAQAAPPGPIDEPMTTAPAPAPLDPAPIPTPKAPVAPDAPATEEPLEVTEDDIAAPPGEAAVPAASDFDNKVDAVFANITVADVVAKLEDLAKIYKTREVPRQLGIVDMMLGSLGLASYFPSLSEATNKALESNNYISTRLEDILSKLRGGMAGNEIDLKGGETTEKPEVAALKGKLQQDEDKEKARKKMRKEQEAAELAGPAKETPEVEIAEDLGAPPAAAPRPPVAPTV